MSLEHIRHYLAERAFQTFSSVQLADVRKSVRVSLRSSLHLARAARLQLRELSATTRAYGRYRRRLLRELVCRR